MNSLDKKYTDLLQDILDNGITKSDRTGTGTLSVFGRQIRHKMSEGFPLITTKKMYFKGITVELLWFLRGDTNIKYLIDNDCHIWNGDALKNYENHNGEIDWGPFVTKEEAFVEMIKTDDQFAKKWGDLGPVYGKQWRSWGNYIQDIMQPHIYSKTKHIDQIANLINDIKTNPDSRRLMVNAWNVGELDQMVLPPCHYGFQVYTRELSASERITYKNCKKTELFDSHELYDFIKNNENVTIDLDEVVHKECDDSNIPKRAISLMWNQRSVDTFLGLPFNIASYGLLLTMIADEMNMVPDELIGNLGDTHIYLNHIEQVNEQIGRELTDEERYNIWFNNNYETGMERFWYPNRLPNFDDPYYKPTPKRTREPYLLPKVSVRDGIYCSSVNDVILENYQSHPSIKAPLSN